MSYITYFDNGFDKYQTGMSHKLLDMGVIEIAKWVTDYNLNTYEKTKNYKSKFNLDQKGEREG
jgi:hypothetical protein